MTRTDRPKAFLKVAVGNGRLQFIVDLPMPWVRLVIIATVTASNSPTLIEVAKMLLGTR